MITYLTKTDCKTLKIANSGQVVEKGKDHSSVILQHPDGEKSAANHMDATSTLHTSC